MFLSPACACLSLLTRNANVAMSGVCFIGDSKLTPALHGLATHADLMFHPAECPGIQCGGAEPGGEKSAAGGPGVTTGGLLQAKGKRRI